MTYFKTLECLTPRESSGEKTFIQHYQVWITFKHFNSNWSVPWPPPKIYCSSFGNLTKGTFADNLFYSYIASWNFPRTCGRMKRRVICSQRWTFHLWGTQCHFLIALTSWCRYFLQVHVFSLTLTRMRWFDFIHCYLILKVLKRYHQSFGLTKHVSGRSTKENSSPVNYSGMCWWC